MGEMPAIEENEPASINITVKWHVSSAACAALLAVDGDASSLYVNFSLRCRGWWFCSLAMSWRARSVPQWVPLSIENPWGALHLVAFAALPEHLASLGATNASCNSCRRQVHGDPKRTLHKLHLPRGARNLFP